MMHDAYFNSRFLSNKSLMFPVAITPLLYVFEESDCGPQTRQYLCNYVCMYITQIQDTVLHDSNSYLP
jgi:hypothetical protein